MKFSDGSLMSDDYARQSGTRIPDVVCSCGCDKFYRCGKDGLPSWADAESMRCCSCDKVQSSFGFREQK